MLCVVYYVINLRRVSLTVCTVNSSCCRCNCVKWHLKIDDFKTLQAAAKEDGAIVIDQRTRQIVCGNYFVGNIAKGDTGDGGGARHKAASAVAQLAGGCYVIKSSEDDCALSATEKPDAILHVFNCCRESAKIPIATSIAA